MNALADTLVQQLRTRFEQLPDPRRGANTQYSFADIVMSGLSVFFMQSPSFLAHQRTFQQQHGRNACQSLFRMTRIPCDNHIRQCLDQLSTERLYPALDDALEWLCKSDALQSFTRLDGRTLIALDGTQFHSSQNIHCQLCNSRRLRSADLEYFHSIVLAALVAPGHNRAIPLRPEFVTPQDGDRKQDCERKAVKRWFHLNQSRYQHLQPVYLGDALYACQTICQTIVQHGDDFLFTAKPGALPTLYEYLKGIPLSHKTTRQRLGGKRTETRHYQWYNGLPLRDGNDALSVNWFSVRITRTGKRPVTFQFVTSLPVNSRNVEALAQGARARWKIENEAFNVLKHHGYHLERNFGHGQHGLANTLATLNLIAFACHAICDELCQLWQQARLTKHTRYRFFAHLEAVNHYWFFHNWTQLLLTLAQQSKPP